MASDLVWIGDASPTYLLNLDIGEPVHDFVIPSTSPEALIGCVRGLVGQRGAHGVREHSGLPVPPTGGQPFFTLTVWAAWTEPYISHFVAHVQRACSSTKIRFAKNKHHTNNLRQICLGAWHAVAVQPPTESGIAS